MDYVSDLPELKVYAAQAFFTEDSFTCYWMQSTGVNNSINYNNVIERNFIEHLGATGLPLIIFYDFSVSFCSFIQPTFSLV